VPNTMRAPRQAQPRLENHRSSQHDDVRLNRNERRNVALASLQIRERHHRLQLAAIALERRALMAGLQ
jgi:hypothetical protein